MQFFFVAPQLQLVPGPTLFEVSRSHTIRHNHLVWPFWVISPSQRQLPTLPITNTRDEHPC